MINKETLEHINYAGISSIDMKVSPLRPSTDIVFCETLVKAAREAIVCSCESVSDNIHCWIYCWERVSDTHTHTASSHKRYKKEG